MSSAPVTPLTDRTVRSQASSSHLSTSAPSSPPSETSPTVKHAEHGRVPGVSDSMREEEERMEAAAVKEEEKRQNKFQVEREQEAEAGEAAVDPKFKRLEYLLSQSKVYSSILMSKMQQQHDDANTADKKEEQRRRRADEEQGKTVPPPRKSTRATANSRETKSSKEKAESSKTVQDKKMLVPSKETKKQGMKIADYFKKDDLQAQAGAASVTEALAQAGEEDDGQVFGAQDLVSARQPDLVSGGVMRSYQLEGLEWLKSLYENGLNGILADEMGLGKTIQTISFLAFLRSKGTHGPFLIAAPLSTLSNWVEEFARWTPTIPVVLYHGSKQEREEIRDTKLVRQNSEQFPVVCTSYEICMNDRKFLASYGWKFIIIDEGHRLKNLNCRLIRELKSYNSANRLLITGTPLQNNLSELWSLLNFLMPEVFDQLESFESWFDFSALQEKEGHKQILVGERKNHIISSLHAILKPFLLRRVKADVETSLPKKREYILYAPLSNTQKDLYRHILEGDSRAYLEDKVVERLTGSATNSPKTSRSGSLKRKAASGTSTPNKSAKSSRDSTPTRSIRGRKGKSRVNYTETSDAEFFRQAQKETEGKSEESDEEDEEEVSRARTIALAKKEIATKKLQNPVMQLRLACDSPHNFYWPWQDAETPDESLVTESGKMMLLDRLMPALFDKDHKVLIFSQFKTQLDIIEDWATAMRGWNVCRIDGQVKQDDRRAQIHAFNTDASYRIFLLSTRAGGQGINLAAADTVILFDSDWNPQQDLQAQDRAHRIGQTRPVIVYRLATRATIEQTLLEKADGKRRLEKLVIQKGKFRSLANAARDDVDELQRILTQDDFEKFDVEESGRRGGGQILSDKDLRVLTDRSEEAYRRAEQGEDGKDGTFKVVETKTEGEGILAEMSR
ncbi:MAG: hypothetical protein M1817_003249 [Caeruleum heppii]|nr:MAG: hypothetical protein M1817_003249 [Caeruleum heppii]